MDDICHIALLVAFAVILDMPFLKFKIGSNGGSISFSMLPLLIIALKKGPFKSFIGIGIIYSTITCLTDGSPLYAFPFDYLLGYGSLCLVGFVPIIHQNISKKYYLLIIFFTIFSIVLRLLFSTVSGILFYHLKFIPSLAYNAVYILPSGGISIVLLLILLKPINRIIKN